MSESSQHDQRWSDRREIATDVKIIFSGRSYYARTRDIGLGGMFIHLNCVLIPRNTMVEVVMLQHKHNGNYVSFKTNVAYVQPQGYGLEFQGFGIGDVRLLQDILYDSPYEVIHMA